MLFRAIALSLALLIGIGTIIPLATNVTLAGAHKTKTYKGKKKYRKYSKQWWRQYHARQRRKKAVAARKRMMRLHQIRLARSQEKAKGSSVETIARGTVESTPMLPTGAPAPQGWRKAASSPSELTFNVDNGAGSAAITVVGPASGETVSTGRNRTVGGVPTSSLRREVINRMINENGWVVNDYQKEIGGRQVYVVAAQSQANGGRVQSRMFYFTEVDGRIYSVAMNSDPDAATRLAEESEKVIFSLSSRSRATQQAAIRE